MRFFGGDGQIDDGQEAEDEGLYGDDQDMVDGPREIEKNLRW